MDLVISNRGQMTRKKFQLTPPSPNFRATLEGEYPVRFNVHQAHRHGGSLVESGFEPGSRLFRNRHLSTKSPRSVVNQRECSPLDCLVLRI
ncbi:hypothetical protein AVEN_114526-1 [Araneus ventricosus]|uniref:Uncharacterized protein n=1 Tax=Araneus ventricosus TaxID=182803 RepID=A0A4Y2UHS8_ARAVE|nr:hypothetical protein AVEN_114526-1 [Araneus ventricosus]